MRSVALDSSGVLLSYPITSLASPMTCQYTNIYPQKHIYLILAVLTQAECVVKLQACWRSKKLRRWLRRRHISAIAVQKVYRGFCTRGPYGQLKLARRDILRREELHSHR